MDYEVYSYKTEEDFNARRPTNVSGFMDKTQAAFLGLRETETNAIVKVQSEDREEIWIIKAHD